jgi:hypothetical protein
MNRILTFACIGILAIGIQAQESESTGGESGTEEKGSAYNTPAKETESTNSAQNEGKKSAFTISGSGNLMFGQVVSGYAFARAGSNHMDHQWQDFYGGNIFVTTHPSDWLTTKVGLEARSAFPITSTSSIMKETFRVQYRSFLPIAEGIFKWNFENQTSLLIESGIFPYNFNPEIKNLGNYLYRGVAYPLYLETKLDYPYYDMAGIRAEYGFLDNTLKVGAILNSVINHAPFFDFSLGFTATYTLPNKVFEIGAGICFDRLLSVDDDATNCVKSYSQAGYDTSWTLKSTKLDTRVTFDLKPLIGNPECFGAQDAKIYGECAILGFKDPKYFIDSTFNYSLANRMPLLVGVNLPVFKILDLLSVEFEFFKSPYMNDWWGLYDGNPSPVPFYSPSWDSTWKENYKTKDNFKWTVYAKKSFGKFDVIGLFANDHIFYDTYSAESQSNTEQSLRTNKNWHWYVKLQYNL